MLASRWTSLKLLCCAKQVSGPDNYTFYSPLSRLNDLRVGGISSSTELLLLWQPLLFLLEAVVWGLPLLIGQSFSLPERHDLKLRAIKEPPPHLQI